MKMPSDPLDKDLAVATGKTSRRKRDQERRIARASSDTVPPHTQNECSGTVTLALIERALTRLSSGTYGICISCGADIGLDRLEDNPAIETCASCDSEVTFKAC